MITHRDERFYELEDLDGEEWGDVPDYKGSYMVSSCGRVKSLDRSVNGRWGYHDVKGKIIKAWDKDPYLSTTFCDARGKKRLTIHRLVAQAFIPNPDNKPEVNHKDGNKHNNHKNNLEWATRSENGQHAHDSGLSVGPKGEVNGMVKITESQAKEIKYGHIGLTGSDVASIYGIHKGSVTRIRRGESWKHI